MTWMTLTGSGSGAGGAQLPSGAFAVYYADQYDATAHAIPNALSATPLSTNLMRAPRRMFTSSSYYTLSGITATDENSTDPDGGTEATSLACTGSWSLGCAANNGNLPAGTYTSAIKAIRTGGSDQTFRTLGNFADPASYSAIKTVTSAWQQFTHTFTLAGSTAPTNFRPMFHDGVPSAANIAVIDCELYAGASVPSAQPLAGHLYLSKSKYSTVPTVGTGYVDFSSGESGGLAQFIANKTWTGITVIALASKVANNAKDYQGMWSNAKSWTNFTQFFERQNLPQNQFGSSVISPTQQIGAWEPDGLGYLTFGASYNGTTGANTTWLNGAKVTSNTITMGQSQSARNFFVAALNTLGNICDFRISAMAVFDRELDKTDHAQAVAVLTARAAASGISLAPARIVIGEGDSLTANGGSMYFSSIPATSPKRIGSVKAVSGSTLANLVSRAAVIDDMVPTELGSNENALVVQIGTNDLSSIDAATYITSLQSYLAARKLVTQRKLGIATILPRNNATFNTRRATVNAWITTSAVADGYADFVVDYAADPTYGVDAAAANATHYPDGIHYSAAGGTAMASILTTALDAL